MVSWCEEHVKDLKVQCKRFHWC